MKSVRLHIQHNNRYFIGFVMLLMAGFFMLLFAGKAAAFVSLNSYHPFWLNVFFINYTFIGDGIFSIVLIAVILFWFKKRQEGLAFLFSFLFSGIAVQVIKNLVNAPRPRLFFEPGQYLYFIEHVSLANYSSFPSGHTATAFAIASTFLLMQKSKKWQLTVLVAAMLVGYSRIYLAQHFLLDVLIGALIGNLAGLLAVCLVKDFKGVQFGYRKIGSFQQDEMLHSPGSIQPV